MKIEIAITYLVTKLFLKKVFLPPLKGSFNPPNQLAPPLSEVTTSTVSSPRLSLAPVRKKTHKNSKYIL